MIGVDRGIRGRPAVAVLASRGNAGRIAICIAMSVILVTGLVEPAAAAATNTASVATDAFLAPTAATAAESADIALDGFGDAEGYHLQIGRGADGFAWQEIAALRPADMDVQSWTGYQCLSGDGRFAAVTILPSDQANDAAARDHGAFAYSVDLS